MTQTLAPILMTVADARLSTPAKSDVIWIIRNTAKVIPTSNAANLARSFTRSLYEMRNIPNTSIRRLSECPDGRAQN
jgi:hypothetical protein